MLTFLASSLLASLSIACERKWLQDQEQDAMSLQERLLFCCSLGSESYLGLINTELCSLINVEWIYQLLTPVPRWLRGLFYGLGLIYKQREEGTLVGVYQRLFSPWKAMFLPRLVSKHFGILGAILLKRKMVWASPTELKIYKQVEVLNDNHVRFIYSFLFSHTTA